jgi:hypothetical protein
MSELPNQEFYLIMNESRQIMTTGDSTADGEGRFPNRETAEAVATRLCSNSAQSDQDLYIVLVTRTAVACVTSRTVVTVTPVEQP